MAQINKSKKEPFAAAAFIPGWIFLACLLVFAGPAFSQYTVSDPGYNWEDISGSGTSVSLSDDDYLMIPIGFTFNFYGNDYTDVFIGSNGYLSFGAGYTVYWTDDGMPNALAPNNMIAGWFGDLYPPVGTIHYETLGVAPNRRLIVQYTNVGHCCSAAYLSTFEFKLYENGDSIEVHYMSTTIQDSLQEHFVGVENADGSSAVVWYSNTLALPPGSAVRFSSNTAPTTTGMDPVTVNEDAVTTDIDLWQSFADAESADGQLTYTVEGNTNPGLFDSINNDGQYLYLDYAPDENGVADITVRATDPESLYVETTFTVTVNAVNDAPSFTSGSNQIMNEDGGAQTVFGWAAGMSAGPLNEAQSLVFNVSNDNNGLFSGQPAVDPVTGDLTYTGAAEANGIATVTVELRDDGDTLNGGTDLSGPQTFTITINPVNDPPMFTAGPNRIVNEDAGPQSASWASGISPGPADEAGQNLTFDVSTNYPALFSVQPAISGATGVLAYTPAADAYGTATVNVRLRDNGGTANGGSDTSGLQTFTITVNAVNDPPDFTAGPDQTVNEGAGPRVVSGWALPISVGPANESSQTFAFTLTNDNPGIFTGQPAINSAGTLTYTLETDANGTATVTATLADNGGIAYGGVNSVTRTFTITVDGINDPPSFVKGPDQTTYEDAGSLSIANWATAISKGPANEAGQILTFDLTNDNPGLFSVQPAVDASGTLAYTTMPDANGSASVSVTLRDNGGTANGGADTSLAQYFVITVDSINDAPLLNASAAMALAPISEDPDDADNPGTVVAEILASAGDSVTDIDDGALEGIAVTDVGGAGAWQYDHDGDGVFADFPADLAEHRAVLLNPAARIRFVPDSNFNGTVPQGIVFRAWDQTFSMNGVTGANTLPNGGVTAFSVNLASASITVAPVNDAPVIAQSDPVEVAMSEDGEPVDFDLTLNAADVDGDSLAWRLAELPGHGDAAAEGTGGSVTVEYAPEPNYNGPDTFVVEVSDGELTDTITVDINIGEVGDAPEIEEGEDNISVEMSEDGVPTPFTLILNASDPDGDTLFWSVFTPAVNGEASVGGEPADVMSVAYTPNPDFNGADSFVVQVSDGGFTDQIMVNVDIGAVNDAPVMEEGDTVTVDMSENGSPDPFALKLSAEDPDGDPLTWRVSSAPSNGNADVDPAGEVSYEPDAGYSGTDRFTIEVSDGTDTDTVTVEVNIESAPLDATFTATSSRQGLAPLAVSFKYDSTSEITGVEWDFGDGNTSTEETPTHTYEKSGSYTVKLTVSGPGGEKTVVKENYVEVLGLRTVSGTVSGSAGGNGVPGCTILIWQGDTIAADGTTNSSGRFELDRLPSAEDYILEILPPDGYKKQFYNGQEERNFAERVSTMDGDRELEITLEAASRLAIRGRVSGDADNPGPLAGVQVNAYSETADFTGSETATADGTYEIKGLEPASDYVVSVTGPGGEYYYSIPAGETAGVYAPKSSAFFWDEATPVTPTDPPLPNIDIIVGPNQGASVSGTVWSDGEPLGGITVNAWSDALETGSTATTDAQGAYKITGLVDVDAGSATEKGYIVDIWTTGYPYQAFDGVDSRDGATLVETGRTDIDFSLKSGYAVSGTVADTDGNPVSGATVRAWSVSEGDGGETTAGADGAYAISKLPPFDDYVVAVYTEDYPVSFYNGKTSSSDADKLDLTQGDASGIDITLDKGRVISGVVYAGDSQTPAPAGSVVVVCSESANACVEAEIDNSGAYEISGLDPDVDDYVISVNAPGFQPAETDGASADNLVLETGYTIRGLVQQDGMPVSGVRVEACSGGECGYAVTTGDASGGFNYEIEGMPAGTYTIQYESEEFETQTLTGVDVSGNTGSLDVSVTKGEGRKISGIIYNLTEGREIFVHARSKTKGASEVISVTGDGSGADPYVIEDLPAGADYQAEISSEYYAYQAYNGRNDWADADFIDLSEQDAEGVDFTLEETNAVISGSVTFPPETGAGEKAKVYAVSESTGAEGSVEVEAAGDTPVGYEIPDLPSGDDYVVSVWPDTGKKQYYDGVSKEIDATSVETDAGPVDFVLDQGASISGRITADDPADIRVEAWSETLGSGNGAAVSEDGTYVVKGLERAADYVVKAEKPGYPPFFYAESETAMSESMAGLVNAEDANPENIDISVGEGKAITGTVRDKSGKPLSGIWIDARSESRGAGSGAFTGDDGVFEIAGLPPGPDYTVKAVPDWALPYAEQAKTDVTAGDDLKFILNSRTGFTLGGTIRDVRDEHVPNVKVEIRSDSLKLFQWSDMDRSGRHDLHVLNRFEFEGLPPADDYMLTAWPPADSGYAVYVLKNISVMDDTDLNIVMEPGSVISGTVYEESGNFEMPVSAVAVTASSLERDFLGEAITDRTGRYTITNAPDASDYVVTTRKKGYASKEKTNLFPGEGIDFLIDAAGSISGTVKDKSTGKPIANVQVEARSDYMDGVRGYSGIAFTDKNGRYSVEGLRREYRDLRTGESVPVEDYIVTVLPEDYPRQSRAGKKLGDTADFALIDSPNNRISGTAGDPAGSPLEAVVVEAFEHGGDLVKKADVNTDGTFVISGLAEDRQYALRFTAFADDGGEYTQWAGVQGSPAQAFGFDDPAPESGINPTDATIYDTGTAVDFRFSADAFSRRKRSAGPALGRVRMLRSSSHPDDTVTGLRSPVSEIVSNDPNVTVTWEPTGEGADEDYLYVFNQESGFVINRRTAPKSPPVRTRSATSAKLVGDDEEFYCHVAAISPRGRIGTTATVGFRIDTVGPSSLNVNPLESASRQYAKLSLGATGATEVYISNINYGEGGEWENWTKTREWKRTEGGDLGKIYVQFRDRAKNVANAPVIAEKAKRWQIRAAAGTNGRIMPSGSVMVNEGEDQVFEITPNRGYELDSVLVDGESVTLADGNTYTFNAVTRDSSISVTFREVWFTVTASAGPNGTIDPSGVIRIQKDSDLTFAITPDPGYTPVALLDGNPVILSEDNQFRFINIDRDYAFSVTFVRDGK